MDKLFKIFIVNLIILGSSISLADEKKIDIKVIYKLLQEKKFEEGIKNLKVLSEQNNIKAQLLFSKILLSGDITPQNFERSYFWAFSALLGGLNESSKIIKKLNNYLTDDQIEKITKTLKEFLKNKSFEKDKRAIIQLAKLHESFTEPPDIMNAYMWYNIAVAQGVKTAKPKRDALIEELNEKDLLDAQTLSIKLFKKINN